MTEIHYFDDPHTDRLVSLVWQLAQELHVTRQRVLALEELLTEGGAIRAGAVDGYRPAGEARERLASDGNALLDRLTRVITEADDHRMPLRDQYIDRLLANG
ncbi:hypothetical protein [Streptosporangium sp. NPDC001681]|uniref:hypothetical protein n=1 Tax=Streptosporangium sp. NPDC001681 TaxID=3154395 RepID=UPI0033346D02